MKDGLQKIAAEVASEDLMSMREEVARLKKALSKKVRNEALIHAEVTEALADLQTIRVPEPRITMGAGGVEAAVLCIGDTQIGKVTKSYDIATAEKRIILAGRKTLKITSMRRHAAKIDTCYVLLLGDTVEGEQVYAHQSWEVECGVYEQACHHAPRILYELIAMLAQGFKKIVVLAVPGNHGRVGLPKQGGNPQTNWDRVAHSTLELMLRDLIRDGRVTFRQPDRDFYLIEDILGWGFLVTHGDKSLRSASDRKVKDATLSWAQTMPKRWRYLVTGHVHHFLARSVNSQTSIVNPSTESGNDFANEELQAASEPMQLLMFVNAEHGLISLNHLYLSERRP